MYEEFTVDIREILSKKRIIDIDTCLPDGVIFVASDGKISWTNTKAPLFFQLSKKELRSCNINDLLENGLELIKKAALEHKALVSKVKGQEKYLEMTSNNISDGYVVDLRDSTQNYKTVTSMMVEQESSKKVNRDKNNFLLKLSNDLKSPLHSIVGFSQAILDGLGGEVSEKQEKYVKIINKNSCELLFLLEKLFELSSSELGITDKEPKVINAISIINSTVKLNEQLYKEKNLSININVDENVPRLMRTSEKTFKLLIQNMIETLIRMTDIGVIKINAMPPSPEFLEVHNINPDNDYIVLSFVNSGAGLPDNEAETIFEPYAVVEKSNKKHLLRAIAMASVKNMVKLLHGVIWTESEVISGTTFNMLFPTGISRAEVLTIKEDTEYPSEVNEEVPAEQPEATVVSEEPEAQLADIKEELESTGKVQA